MDGHYRKKAQTERSTAKGGLAFSIRTPTFLKTVFADIAFGPKNLGLPRAIAKRVRKAMDMASLDLSYLLALSGGENEG